tara:strand:- start:825 stop:1121 length:297 start_codon:yes stop_codon:yes gene_type:complete
MSLDDRFKKFSFTMVTHKGHRIKNIVSNDKWTYLADTLDRYDFNLAIVPNGMEGRPDLISNSIYNTPDLWWLICAANNIIDPFEELISGKKIKIPIID